MTLLLCALVTASAFQTRPPTNNTQERGTRSAGVKPKQPPARATKKLGGATTDRQSRATGKSVELKTLENVLAESLESVAPVLATADFDLVGLAVAASPATQTVPKNTPTSVLTGVQVPEGSDPAAIAAGLNPNYRVRGELTGPSLTSPRSVEAPIGQPLSLPPLTQAGDHILQNLRVVEIGAEGEPIVAAVTPDSCGIVVIERLLISEVRVNELTYDQIVQAGINITDDSYTAFNFTLGLGTSSDTQSISIPVAFPAVGQVNLPPVVGIPSTNTPGTDVPTVLPVLLTVEGEDGEEGGGAPPMLGGEPVRIPGVIVFPGRVGLLHQFFEAIVIVGNGAPNGAPLIIRDLRARAKLPDNATPPDATDDPLRIAETQTGGSISELELHGLGPDEKYGTADDTLSFAPGQSGQATFLLEGLKEGLHTVNFDLEAMLEGLPIGPVKVRGEVPGAVLVRDASFAVTFTHPSVVRAGQQYDLAMTLYNSGSRDLQGAFARLAGNSISGAELIGQESGERQFTTTIKRQESATVMWRLRATVTGAVTASYVKVGEGVSAGLSLVTGVGDRNVPLSPESLILPDPVRHLPSGVVEAGRAVLGQAWSIANAPPGSLPPGVTPLTKQTVINRAVELGIAGMRVDFGEPVSVSLETLLRDWLGELQESPDAGFADALRDTPAGDEWSDSIGAELSRRLLPGQSSALTPAELHREFADTESSRSPFISALVTQPDGPAMFGARFVDSQNRRVGFGAAADERAGDWRSGAAMRLARTDLISGARSTLGQMLVVSNPGTEAWTLELSGWQSGVIDVSLLVPAGSRAYRQLVWSGVQFNQGGKQRIVFRPGTASGTPALEEYRDGSYQAIGGAATVTTLNQPAPRLVGAIQVTPDVAPGGDKYGRLVGLLFSKPMLKAPAETAARYTVGGGALKGANPPEQVGSLIKVTGAKLDYGDRFVFLGLDSTIGPYIERTVTLTGLTDARRLALMPTPTTATITPRVSPEGLPPGAYLTGRVVNADGTPVASAQVIYWTQECANPAAISSMPPPPKPIAQRSTDAQGRYQIDYVRDGDCGPLRVTVTNPATKSEKLLTSPVAYDGQHMTFDLVFLARGHVQGTITSGGRVMPKAFVRVVPDLDVVGTKVVQADDAGHYLAKDVPVGNVSVLAVGFDADSNASGLAAGTIEGPNQTATINVALQNIAGVVRGRVVRPDGSASVGSLIVARASIPGFDDNTPVGYAYSDRDGSFRIANLPIGVVRLNVSDYVTALYASQTVQLSQALPEISGVLITLPGIGAVTGQVTDETGNPVANARVSSAGQSVRTNALGEYTLLNLPAGRHPVEAQDPHTGLRGMALAPVRLGETTSGVNLTILRPATLQGRVLMIEQGTNTPQPLAGAIVSADGLTQVRTDTQGRYTLSNVRPNTSHLLRVVETRKKLAVNIPVHVSPGETLTRDATLRSSSLRGRVFQPDGVTPTTAPVAVYAPQVNLDSGFDFGIVSVNDSPAFVTQTTSDGAYSISGLNPGKYRVSAANVFFPTQVSNGGTLLPNTEQECNLTLVNTLAGKIQGRVFESDGQTPVSPGIRVTLGGGSLADATVRTDENGRYEFGEVFSAGGYTLTATDPGTGSSNRVYISVEKNKDVVADIRLLGVGGLRVQVFDGAGNPVSSGQMTLDGMAYPNVQRFAEMTPENGGVVQFDNLPEGTYGISATERGKGGRASATVPINSIVETQIQLQAAGTIQGQVFMPGGTTPVGLADVELRLNGRAVGFTVTSDVESEVGKFSFLNIPTGEFTLNIFDNRTGRVGRSAGRVTAQDQIVNVNVELLPVGAVSGRVTANGAPVDHALVRISADGSGVRGANLLATTDPDGRYRFTGIPVGRFYISVADAPGGQTGSTTGSVTGTIEPLPETIADVVLEPRQTVTGTVYQPGGTETVPGAAVIIRVGGRTYRTPTGENGAYRLEFVPLGEVRVRATAPAGYERGEAAPVVGTQPGGTTTADVKLSGTGTITGAAVDSNGAPLSIGSVTFTNNEWEGETPIILVTGAQANGRYEIKGAPAGRFSLRLTVPDRVGSGTAVGEVVANQTVEVPIRLEDAGRITGTVKAEGGNSIAVGADVALSLIRANGQSVPFYAHSNSQGVFSFDNVPLGAAVINVADVYSGTQARRSGVALLANGQIIDLGDLVLSSGGILDGLVTNANNQPVGGVQIALTASNGTFSATTAANGRYHFDPVGLGSFTLEADDPVSGLRRQATGSIEFTAQTRSLNIRLIAAGTVSGIVRQSDGATPVANAQVSLFTALPDGSPINSTVADAQGRYIFDDVPLGSFVVDVRDPANGDRGRVSNQLTASGETRTIDVVMNGLGGVAVTVRDSANNPLGGAQVTVTSQTFFGGNQSGTTQPDGAVTFDQVLAGSFSISARDADNRLSGFAQGSVTAGGTTSISVQLQPSATITGRIFDIDRTTPVSGLTVRASNNNYYSNVVRQSTSEENGYYRFDGLPLGYTYSLDVLDTVGRVRARAGNINLTTNGEVVTRDLALNGLGAIGGRVFNLDGTTAPNLGVTLRSLNAEVGGFFNATTDAQGEYSFTSVPIGRFIATAANSQQNLQGESSAEITQDGQSVAVDIQLVSNAVNLPTVLYDANNTYFELQGSGSIRNDVFSGDYYSSDRGGFLLDIIDAGGAATRFSGGTIGAKEESGREIVMRQQNVAGLDVTRKVYIPGDGYFARYLEILSNPTADPVTVTVRVQSNLSSYCSALGTIASSSGDAALNVSDAANPDRWVVIDDDDDGENEAAYCGDSGPMTPAVAFAFDGLNAAERAGEANYTDSNYGGQLSYQWNNVTIAPGAKVAYLHFGVQQQRRVSARPSVERLTQLPPEALAGLSAEEIGEIRNFAVPANGASALAALPALNGRITGRVLASDLATTIPEGWVRLQSHNLLFGRTRSVQRDANGAFTFNSSLDADGNSVVIPLEGFTLVAEHAQTGLRSVPATGNFAPNETTATQDVVFSNTGIVRGVVRRHTGATVAGGTISINGGNPHTYQQVNIGADGSYQFTAVTQGNSTLSVSINHGQGSPLTGTAIVTVAAGRTEMKDLMIQPTGSVSGTTRDAAGNPATSVIVQLRNGNDYSSFARSLRTDAAGQFTFSDIPVGFFTLQATEPRSGVSSTAQVNVAQDQTAARDLTLIGVGQVQVQVNFANGAPANRSAVQIKETAKGNSYRYAGQTDAAGRRTITNVPVGAFTVQASNPNNSSISAEVAGHLANYGDAVSTTVTLPGIGAVTGRVTFADGAPAANSRVELYGQNLQSRSASTDANGNYTITQVQVGRSFTVRANSAAHSSIYQETLNQTIANDGDTLTVNLAFPPLATVRVTVLKADGTPFANVEVSIQDSLGQYSRSAGVTNTSGVLSIPQVPEGNFTVSARDPNTGAAAGSASGVVAATDQGSTIEITLNAPLSGNVRGTIYAGDGQTPLTGVTNHVEVFDVATNQQLAGSDFYDGTYQFNSIATGSEGFRVRVRSPFDASVTAEKTGKFTNTGDTVELNFTLPVSIVRGTVSFAVGTTRVPYPSVYLSQTDANDETRTFYTNASDEQGHYTVFGAAVGAFSLTAQDGDSGLTAETAGSIADAAVPVMVDVTLPPSGAVNGRITKRDAAGTVSGVAAAYVTLLADGESFERATYADDEGNYTFDRAALGSFTVQAQDPNNWGVTGAGAGTLATAGETATVNIQMPDTGSIDGLVVDSDGTTPLANVQVIVSSPGLAFERFVSTDAGGAYRFTGMPLGSFALHVARSEYENGSETYGSATGVLTGVNGAITVNVTMSPTAAVSGRVLKADGAAGAGASVTVEGFAGSGTRGHFSREVTADASGTYEMSGVPIGIVRISAYDPATDQSGHNMSGFVEGTLAPAGLSGLDVTLGNAFSFIYYLDGTDGFRYDLQGWGNLGSGGTTDGALSAFNTSHYLILNGHDRVPDVSHGITEEDGREVVVGQTGLDNLSLTRKIFSPAEGRFARYLEILTNPTGASITVNVKTEVNLSSSNETRVVVSPAATGQLYAVTDNRNVARNPALAFVFGGPGAPTTLNAARFRNKTQYHSYNWNVTVPAGQTRILMHYVAQRSARDSAGARMQAEALVNLSDPLALFGVGATEKSQIVNFQIP